MDELEFRRRVYANPDTTDKEVIDAARQDPAKQAFWNEQKKLDQQLLSALKVPVPEDLANKLIWQQSMQEFVRHKKRSHWFMALAASVAFTVGVSFTLWYEQQPVSIDRQALAHVHLAEEEQPHSALPVDMHQVNAKLASFGAQFTQDLGNVVVANYCHLQSVQSLHLIIDTAQGKMSVFVVPHNDHMDMPFHFADSEFQGNGFVMHNANIMVVGEKGADLTPLTEKVKNSIVFSA